MAPQLHHFHTYFFFPFTISKELVAREHPDYWEKHKFWIHGLDACVAGHATCGSPVVQALGNWQRAAYSRSDMDSPAYQDMIFFHPYVRRIFFDTGDDPTSTGDREPLIRCFVIPVHGAGGEAAAARRKVWMLCEDRRGRSARVQVTDLRLFLFANGMGILSFGLEAWDLSVTEALWINETMRKIYPSSGRQIREGRGPSRFALLVEEGDGERLVVEETYESVTMESCRPPLSRLITSLIYFLDYGKNEYEQLLDERMMVYTYAAIDLKSVPPEFVHSPDYQILISRFLYVDRDGPSFRYDPAFVRRQMREHLYRRWAHEGTWYGYTSYSAIATCVGEKDRGEHVAQEGFLIHRMFDTRYYLMAIIALFYRATLLDFAQKTAVVSRQLFRDLEAGQVSRETIDLATALRAEFLHFTNYWYFEELANKDEEIEHFSLQCRNYRVPLMKSEVEQEIEKLNAAVHEYFQTRSTDAVNRLAMVSMIFGAGAVVTGFYGMNFEREFGMVIFSGQQYPWMHYLAMIGASLVAFGAIAFGVFIVLANPVEYKDILTPRQMRQRRRRGILWSMLKRKV